MNKLILISAFFIVYLILLIVDFRPIYKKENSLLSFLYIFIMLFTYILFILVALDIDVPNPTVFIEKLVSSIIPINY